MKKTILLVSVLSMLLGPIGSGIAGAQVSYQTNAGVSNQTSAGVGNQVKFLRHLGQGLSGDDIKLLQAILAADSSVYAEGLITGKFGPLTAKAVAKFQAKYGIKATGFVGPVTLAKLNAIKESQELALETDAKGIKRPCAIVPPGHLIAPGWLRKHDGVRPVVPVCQNLPAGIAAKIDGLAAISAVAVSNISGTGATISFKTATAATGKVYYSAARPINLQTAANVTGEANTTVHVINLSGLTNNTTYYFVVEAKTADGNVSVSGEQTFTTSNVADVTPPTISGVAAANVSARAAIVKWTTNEAATSKVYYSTSNSPMTDGSVINQSAMVTNHAITLSNLSADTTYYFVVESRDSSNNVAVSSRNSFTTGESNGNDDTEAPVVSSVNTSVTANSASISWKTNENATGKVYYSTTSPVDINVAANVSANVSAKAQSVSLTGLSSSTVYYFVIVAKDGSGNASTAGTFAFTTAASGDNTAPTVSAVTVAVTSTTAVINWTSSEAASSKVYYSVSSPVNKATAQVAASADLTVNHSMTLTGLSSDTEYHFVIESKDSSNNVSTSAEHDFTTNG